MQSIQEQNIKTQTGKNVRQITPAFNIYIFSGNYKGEQMDLKQIKSIKKHIDH